MVLGTVELHGGMPSLCLCLMAVYTGVHYQLVVYASCSRITDDHGVSRKAIVEPLSLVLAPGFSFNVIFKPCCMCQGGLLSVSPQGIIPIIGNE
jgi:hypothetical protein